MKKKLILIISSIVTTLLIICFICFQMLNNRPPKLRNIKTIRVEYSSRLIESFSVISPHEITETEQISQLVNCFNVKSKYGIGCDCPSNDIIIYFISEEREYVYNIGITGDARIQYTKVSDKDIFGININDIISILNKSRGPEKIEYPNDL